MIEMTKKRAAPDPSIRTPRVVHQQARISRIEQLSHDTVELVLKTIADKQPMHAKAGQFCTIHVPEIKLTRAYSLARAPDAERANEYTFIIRLIPDGALSQWLLASERIGHEVQLAGPLGSFVLDNSNFPIICIAGGSGMSATHAIIEQAQISRLARDCYFFYGARTSADLYLTDEILKLQNSWHPEFDFRFVPTLSEEPSSSNWKGRRGLVGEIAISTLENDGGINLREAKYYLCGPPGMINATVASLDALGVAPANYKFDKFEDANGPAPKIDNTRCVLCDECLLVKPTPDCIVESSNVTSDGSLLKVVPLETAGLYYNALVIDDAQCIRCHACISACPHGAISVDYSTPTKTLRQFSLAD